MFNFCIQLMMFLENNVVLHTATKRRLKEIFWGFFRVITESNKEKLVRGN